MRAAPTTRTIRLSSELVQEAEQEAEFFKRSISGQVEYWASLGRAIEGAPGFTLDRTRAALSGEFDADLLSFAERAMFDEGLGQALAQPSKKELAAFAQMAQDGGGVGYNDQGQLVRALPGGAVEVIG